MFVSCNLCTTENEQILKNIPKCIHFFRPRPLKLWDRVVYIPDLLTAIATINVTKVQTVSNLRKKFPAEEVSIAIELTRARTSAKGRLENAETFVGE